MTWKRCILSQQTFNGKTNVFILKNTVVRRFFNSECSANAEAVKGPGLLPSISPLQQGNHRKRRRSPHQLLKTKSNPAQMMMMHLLNHSNY